MTAVGWLFMLTSVGFVTGLVVFCYVRVLRPRGKDEATTRNSSGS